MNGLGVFETVGTGIPPNTNTSDTFDVFLSGGTITSMGTMWGVVLTVSGIGAVVAAIFIHSAIPIGAYIFSGIFWTSYINSLGVLNDLYIPGNFLLIGTVIMLFFWCGAVAGMFSGSG